LGHTLQFVACTLLTTLALVFPVSAQTVLKLNSQWPATTAGSKIDQWFAEEVGKRTNGQVQVKVYWSEALGKATEMLGLMQSGAIEMAAMSSAYYPKQLPFHAAPNSLPMAMDTVQQANLLIRRLVTEVPAYVEEAEDNGVRPLFFHHLNPYLLVSKQPILKIDDMKGRKMRTWGTDMPRMVQAAGGTPINLALPEIYESLNSGVIDSAPFAVDLIVNYKIYEVAKNVSEITLWLGPSWGLWINQASWQKLTPEQQAIFISIAADAARRDLEVTIAAEKSARDELAKRGVVFHPFPEAEKAKWRAANPDFFADFIATMDKEGKGNAARQTIGIWKQVVGAAN
jgi:TRAP-type C4-dicarboxylate transport system substrate-binding protein